MRTLLFFSIAILLAGSITAQKGLKTILAEHKFSNQEGVEKSLADIIKSHEGEIRVNSEPGKGSVFKLIFPLSTSE